MATRLRERLASERGLTEKAMFGGLAMMIDGNMAVGVFKDDLLVRTDPAEQDNLLAEPGARMFDMVKQRPMKGWIVVDAEHCGDDDDFERWVGRGLAYARSLPKK